MDVTGLNIMVVDDNRLYIKVLEDILKNNGIKNIVSEREGKKAVEDTLTHKIDLIIMDIEMPEMNGFEACKLIKENPLTRDIPIIFLTARKDDNAILEAFHVGGADYISKPFNAAEIIERIKTHVTLRRSNEQLRKATEEQKIRDRLLSALADSLNELITNNDLTSAINKCSEKIGKATNIDRLYIIENKVNEADKLWDIKNSYSWESSFASTVGNYIDQIKAAIEIMPDFKNKIMKKEIYNISKNEFTEELNKLFEEHKVDSILIIPIFVDDLYWGFVWFEECKFERVWSEGEKSIVNSFAAAIGSSVNRKRMEQVLEKAKEDAEEANKSKSDFLANMSHEIRTPLNSIIGYTEILAEEEVDKEKLRRMNIVISSGKHLLNVINDILDFSKIEVGKIDFERKNFSLRDMLVNIRNMFGLISKQKKLSFPIVIDNDVPEFVLGDEHRVKQILINIVSNAFKFTERGEVSITCTYRKGMAYFDVVDTGGGIAPDKQELIFSAFEQGGSEITRKFGGTGLGLSISRGLARSMGGDISLESQLGKGSKFTVAIEAPFADSESASEPNEKMADNWIGKDPEIEDLVLYAITKIPEMTAELKAVVEKGNVNDINFLSHKMKGFYGNYNMTELLDIAEKINIETMKTHCDMEKVVKCIEQLEEIGRKIPDKYFSTKKEAKKEEKKEEKKITVINEKQEFSEQEKNLEPEKKPLLEINVGIEKGQADVDENKFRILVAEDVEENRNLVDLILKKSGAIIRYAENGVITLEMLEKDRYDLLLLDVQMPIMGGFEAIKKIRENKKYDDLYVIALTAQASTKDKEEMLGAGCNGYITKPIDKNILRGEVKKLMERGKSDGQ